MSESVFLVVVSGGRWAAICRHDLQALIQGYYGDFKVQALSVSNFYWEIVPRIFALVVLIVIKIHTDGKPAITVERKNNVEAWQTFTDRKQKRLLTFQVLSSIAVVERERYWVLVWLELVFFSVLFRKWRQFWCAFAKFLIWNRETFSSYFLRQMNWIHAPSIACNAPEVLKFIAFKETLMQVYFTHFRWDTVALLLVSSQQKKWCRCSSSNNRMEYRTRLLLLE